MTIREAAPIIKQRITSRQIVEFYGYTPNRGGFIKCPFHDDHDASLKVHKSGWFCYGCSRGGDAVEFIKLHEHCSFRDAVVKADAYFHLDLVKPEKVSFDTLMARRDVNKHLRALERIRDASKQTALVLLEKAAQEEWNTYRDAWSKSPAERTAIDWWNMVVCKEAMMEIDEEIKEINDMR